MSSITRFSIVTLLLFVLSIVFVIRPLHVPLRLPYFGRRRFPINLTTAPIIIIAILWASQCLGATQIRNGIVGVDDVKPYNILILFFSLAYMAITLDVTGLLQAAAFWVSNKGGTHGWRLYVYFYLLLTIVSVVVGNDPVILSGTVFLVYYTNAIGLEPLPWLMAEFLAANTASMVLFVGNPTNVVVCEGFAIINAAFTAYTILPFLACSVFGFLAMAIQFRDQKHIPRKFPSAGTLNVRGALHDPISALVGSIILGACLVVIIVTSFFGVDVWKISLPFAVAKFGFDMSWDHYRYKKGKRNPDIEDNEHKPGDASTGAGYELENSNGGDDPVLSEIRRAVTVSSAEGFRTPAVDRKSTIASNSPTLLNREAVGITRAAGIDDGPPSPSQSSGATRADNDSSPPPLFPKQRAHLRKIHARLSRHFPTFFTALPRLPFALVPFAFSQFILIEALSHQGWIEVFARWLVSATGREIHPSIWLVGVLGVVLCNISGTNIGATILLTKVVRAAPDFPPEATRAAGIALAVSTNIGAVGATFSASLAGLLWASILEQKGIHIKQRTFAFWNFFPIVVMTVVGLGVVSAEMAVLY
ncbi:hypothetical protein CYLTODRAFT_420912 [Cylindrobasidium torrendii FP15055 ss-10]|uniref:Citrate transporter-like domain-containing protein n=1 Tax=Cylindrobasidium torrendii FP15055 ss-10 TaxID=1314674 RepID=A0A0D7BFC6_9AGAR|nr:hypothetical protein CYLTODRAFT_420912 [Cylindrobasidium torrendii FP15055 ss-10]